jgi:hypothetical protein
MSGNWLCQMNRWAPYALTPLVVLAALPAIGLGPWVTLTVAGLTMGIMLFLVAAGLTLIFGLMDVLNFGHGAFISLGAYTTTLLLLPLSGWLAALATSKDLVHWEKKGPALDLGRPGDDDSKSASYGVTFFDGHKWHMDRDIGLAWLDLEKNWITQSSCVEHSRLRQLQRKDGGYLKQ